MKCHFLFCLLALVLLHSISGQQQCSINEVYKECGGCDQICNFEPIFCTQDCSYPGCYCQDGYVRSFEAGICIPKTICQPQCPVNEEYKECGGCDQFCNSEPVFCTQDCSYPGCYCQVGFVRSTEGGSCIPETSCESESQSQCPANEEYKECGGCDQICNDEPVSCTQDCSYPGCYCQAGFVRSTEGGNCIPETSCQSQCPVNEEYKECGGCDQICDAEPVFCTQDCSYPGCYCQAGFVRSTEGGSCIPESFCQQQCSINEVYKNCGGCDQICNLEPIVCTQDCSYPGCYCQKGYVRSFEGGICIPNTICQPQCPANEEYKECGSCDQICNHEPIFCTQDCSYPGCYCQAGFVRSTERGRCVPKSGCGQLKCDRPNEEYQCGSACQTTCENLGTPCPIVNIRCNDDCYCIEGYARASNGTCIDQDEC